MKAVRENLGSKVSDGNQNHEPKEGRETSEKVFRFELESHLETVIDVFTSICLLKSRMIVWTLVIPRAGRFF